MYLFEKGNEMENNYNFENVNIIREYFVRLKEGKGYAQVTSESKLRDVIEFDLYLNGQDYRRLTKEIAIEYKKFLREKKWQGNPIGLKTVSQKLSSIVEFYNWLRIQPRYKSRVDGSAIEYFSLSLGERNALKTQVNLRDIPSLDDILNLIKSIKGNSEIEMRDRALIAFILMSGIRVGSITTLKLADFDIHKLRVTLNPLKGAKTKNKKAFRVGLTVFHDELLNQFIKWVNHLTDIKKFTPEMPLFPMAAIEQSGDSLSYIAENVKAEPWKSTGSINIILKKRSDEAGLPYFNPHSYRSTIIQICKSLNLTIEEMSAISQNLGQNDLHIAEVSYATMEPNTRLNKITNIDFSKPANRNIEQNYESLKVDVNQKIESLNKHLDNKIESMNEGLNKKLDKIFDYLSERNDSSNT